MVKCIIAKVMVLSIGFPRKAQIGIIPVSAILGARSRNGKEYFSMSAIGALNPGRSRNRRVPSPGAVAPDNRRSDADESGWSWWSAPRFRSLLPLPGNPHHPVRYQFQRWPYLHSSIAGLRLRTLSRESIG